MPWIASLALGAYSGYQQKRGAEKAEAGANMGTEAAKAARAGAVAALSDRKIYGASEFLFPGLVPNPIGVGERSLSPFGGGKGTLGPEESDKMSKKAAKLRAQSEKQAALGHHKRSVMKAKHADRVDKRISAAQAESDPWAYLNAQVPATTATPDARQAPPLSNPLDATHGGVTPAEIPHIGPWPGQGQPTNPNQPPAPTQTPSYPQTGPGTPPAQPQPPTTPGPTAPANPALAPQSAPQSPGQLVMGHLMDYLKNPGQLGSETYERAQENANQGLNVTRGLGNITGAGVDPRSGIGMATTQGGILNFAKQRNEAARDYSMAQEMLRRQDISQASQMYQDFLSQIFGLQGQRAAVGAGGPGAAYSGNQAGAGNAAIGAWAAGAAEALGKQE